MCQIVGCIAFDRQCAKIFSCGRLLQVTEWPKCTKLGLGSDSSTGIKVLSMIDRYHSNVTLQTWTIISSLISNMSHFAAAIALACCMAIVLCSRHRGPLMFKTRRTPYLVFYAKRQTTSRVKQGKYVNLPITAPPTTTRSRIPKPLKNQPIPIFDTRLGVITAATPAAGLRSMFPKAKAPAAC
jgi:hypothetical protein